MPRDFDWRFQNWLAWAKMRDSKRSKAMSAEGLYRSPQVWYAPTPKPDWLVELDHNDAIAVNRAFLKLDFNTRRAIKVLFFLTHLRPQAQGQRIGVHYTKLGEAAHKAKMMLENCLRLTEQKIKVRVVVRQFG